MKEKDLENNLDNLIIDGLIKEAEQDNKDFEIAMRNMSDEDFLALIYDSVPTSKHPWLEMEDSHCSFALDGFSDENTHKDIVFSENARFEDMEIPHASLNKRYSKSAVCLSKDETASFEEPKVASAKNKSSVRPKRWLPWLAATISAAAVVMAVLIPAFYRMNSRACENALFAMETYLPSAKGGDDISMASQDEIMKMLPELEATYEQALRRGEDRSSYAEFPSHQEEGQDYYIATTDEAAWDLVEAYLRIGEKKKAIAILNTLADKYGDTEDGDFCRHLIKILE